MGNTEIVHVTVTIDEKEGRLTYHLLIDTIEHENAYLPVYGVSVTLHIAEKSEYCKIHNVTSCRQEMLKLIYKMAEGTVFPISTKDIIEDFIA